MRDRRSRSPKCTQLAQVVSFDRTFDVAGEFKLVPPEAALKRFERDRIFSKVAPGSGTVTIRRMALGYYALPPAAFQRYYLPVYAVDAAMANERRSDLQQEFRRYVTAVDMSRDEMQRLRPVSDPGRFIAF